jgi:hypothetical protein
MPNIMSNYIFVHGKEENVDALRRTMARDDLVFDFNAIVPMPQDLMVPCNTDIFPSFVRAMIRHHKRIPDYLTCCLMDLRRKDPETLAVLDEKLGEQLYRNYQRYDCLTWYTWRLGHWGVKWNAAQGIIHKETTDSKGNKTLLYQFETAWSPIPGLIRKLSRRFPTVKITYYYVEERLLALNGMLQYQCGRKIREIEAKPDSPQAYTIARKFYNTKTLNRYYRYDARTKCYEPR